MKDVDEAEEECQECRQYQPKLEYLKCLPTYGEVRVSLHRTKIKYLMPRFVST